MEYEKYSDITLLESSNVLEEAVNINTIIKLAQMIGAVTSAGMGVFKAIKLGQKSAQNQEIYYISNNELTASTTPTYGYQSKRAAIIAYAAKIGIHNGEKNTFFVNNTQMKKVEEKVYLYKFNTNMDANKMENKSFVDICKSANVNFEIKDKNQSNESKPAKDKNDNK